MSTFSAFEDIEHGLSGKRTRRVWTYWRERAGAALAPDWASFDLMGVYQDAPITLVLDVLPQANGEFDYLYRYVGTKIVQYRWRLPVPDHTGLTYSQASHQYNFCEVKAAYDKCAATGRSMLMRRDFDAFDASGVHERLILPICRADRGGTDKLAVVVERLTETPKHSSEAPPHF